jgi:hypothetical protein
LRRQREIRIFTAPTSRPLRVKEKKVDRLKATGGSAKQLPRSIVLINQSEANKE